MGKFVIETPLAFTEQFKFATFDAELYEMPQRSATRILTPGSKYVVEVSVELGAKLKCLLCGEWCVSVAAESIGPGFEGIVQRVFPMDNVDPQADKISIELPFEWFNEGHKSPDCRECGTVFELVCTVVAQDRCHKPIGLAGFARLGKVMIPSSETVAV
jgi:hypothetical protein